jgi:central glycolytic genes regulator
VEVIQLSVARRMVPELLETLRSRATILHRVQLLQPIGRRALADELGTTERILRSEVDFLRRQGLIAATAAGMSLTEEGHSLLEEVDELLAATEGRAELATRLSRQLFIPKVLVVQGDSDTDEWVKDTLGYQAATQLRALLLDEDVLAVTGGTTMAAVAQMMPVKGETRKVRVVPARGGLGETVSVQANTIAAELAQRLGGDSIMLHVPDRLSQETLDQLMNEPQVQERLKALRQANVVIHGIGGALRMATRRQMDADEIRSLQQCGAVAEAFGYYFNSDGEIVHTMTTVGLRLDDIRTMRTVMGVAGGHSKAQAIAAAAKAYRMDVLVTDEGAAKAILEPS